MMFKNGRGMVLPPPATVKSSSKESSMVSRFLLTRFAFLPTEKDLLRWKSIMSRRILVIAVVILVCFVQTIVFARPYHHRRHFDNGGHQHNITGLSGNRNEHYHTNEPRQPQHLVELRPRGFFYTTRPVFGPASGNNINPYHHPRRVHRYRQPASLYAKLLNRLHNKAVQMHRERDNGKLYTTTRSINQSTTTQKQPSQHTQTSLFLGKFIISTTAPVLVTDKNRQGPKLFAASETTPINNPLLSKTTLELTNSNDSQTIPITPENQLEDSKQNGDVTSTPSTFPYHHTPNPENILPTTKQSYVSQTANMHITTTSSKMPSAGNNHTSQDFSPISSYSTSKPSEMPTTTTSTTPYSNDKTISSVVEATKVNSFTFNYNTAASNYFLETKSTSIPTVFPMYSTSAISNSNLTNTTISISSKIPIISSELTSSTFPTTDFTTSSFETIITSITNSIEASSSNLTTLSPEEVSATTDFNGYSSNNSNDSTFTYSATTDIPTTDFTTTSFTNSLETTASNLLTTISSVHTTTYSDVLVITNSSTISNDTTIFTADFPTTLFNNTIETTSQNSSTNITSETIYATTDFAFTSTLDSTTTISSETTTIESNLTTDSSTISNDTTIFTTGLSTIYFTTPSYETISFINSLDTTLPNLATTFSSETITSVSDLISTKDSHANDTTYTSISTTEFPTDFTTSSYFPTLFTNYLETNSPYLSTTISFETVATTTNSDLTSTTDFFITNFIETTSPNPATTITSETIPTTTDFDFTSTLDSSTVSNETIYTATPTTHSSTTNFTTLSFDSIPITPYTTSINEISTTDFSNVSNDITTLNLPTIFINETASNSSDTITSSIETTFEFNSFSTMYDFANNSDSSIETSDLSTPKDLNINYTSYIVETTTPINANIPTANFIRTISLDELYSSDSSKTELVTSPIETISYTGESNLSDFTTTDSNTSPFETISTSSYTTESNSLDFTTESLFETIPKASYTTESNSSDFTTESNTLSFETNSTALFTTESNFSDFTTTDLNTSPFEKISTGSYTTELNSLDFTTESTTSPLETNSTASFITESNSSDFTIESFFETTPTASYTTESYLSDFTTKSLFETISTASYTTESNLSDFTTESLFETIPAASYTTESNLSDFITESLFETIPTASYTADFTTESKTSLFETISTASYTEPNLSEFTTESTTSSFETIPTAPYTTGSNLSDFTTTDFNTSTFETIPTASYTTESNLSDFITESLFETISTASYTTESNPSDFITESLFETIPTALYTADFTTESKTSLFETISTASYTETNLSDFTTESTTSSFETIPTAPYTTESNLSDFTTTDFNTSTFETIPTASYTTESNLSDFTTESLFETIPTASYTADFTTESKTSLFETISTASYTESNLSDFTTESTTSSFESIPTVSYITESNLSDFTKTDFNTSPFETNPTGSYTTESNSSDFTTESNSSDFTTESNTSPFETISTASYTTESTTSDFTTIELNKSSFEPIPTASFTSVIDSVTTSNYVSYFIEHNNFDGSSIGDINSINNNTTINPLILEKKINEIKDIRKEKIEDNSKIKSKANLEDETFLIYPTDESRFLLLTANKEKDNKLAFFQVKEKVRGDIPVYESNGDISHSEMNSNDNKNIRGIDDYDYLLLDPKIEEISSIDDMYEDMIIINSTEPSVSITIENNYDNEFGTVTEDFLTKSALADDILTTSTQLPLPYNNIVNSKLFSIVKDDHSTTIDSLTYTDSTIYDYIDITSNNILNITTTDEFDETSASNPNIITTLEISTVSSFGYIDPNNESSSSSTVDNTSSFSTTYMHIDDSTTNVISTLRPRTVFSDEYTITTNTNTDSTISEDISENNLVLATTSMPVDNSNSTIDYTYSTLTEDILTTSESNTILTTSLFDVDSSNFTTDIIFTITPTIDSWDNLTEATKTFTDSTISEDILNTSDYYVALTTTTTLGNYALDYTGSAASEDILTKSESNEILTTSIDVDTTIESTYSYNIQKTTFELIPEELPSISSYIINNDSISQGFEGTTITTTNTIKDREEFYNSNTTSTKAPNTSLTNLNVMQLTSQNEDINVTNKEDKMTNSSTATYDLYLTSSTIIDNPGPTRANLIKPPIDDSSSSNQSDYITFTTDSSSIPDTEYSREFLIFNITEPFTTLALITTETSITEGLLNTSSTTLSITEELLSTTLTKNDSEITSTSFYVSEDSIYSKKSEMVASFNSFDYIPSTTYPSSTADIISTTEFPIFNKTEPFTTLLLDMIPTLMATESSISEQLSNTLSITTRTTEGVVSSTLDKNNSQITTPLITTTSSYVSEEIIITTTESNQNPEIVTSPDEDEPFTINLDLDISEEIEITTNNLDSITTTQQFEKTTTMTHSSSAFTNLSSTTSYVSEDISSITAENIKNPEIVNEGGSYSIDLNLNITEAVTNTQKLDNISTTLQPPAATDLLTNATMEQSSSTLANSSGYLFDKLEEESNLEEYDFYDEENINFPLIPEDFIYDYTDISESDKQIDSSEDGKVINSNPKQQFNLLKGSEFESSKNDDENSKLIWNGQRLVQIIPVVIEELRQGTVTEAETQMLQEVYGEMWKYIVAVANSPASTAMGTSIIADLIRKKQAENQEQKEQSGDILKRFDVGVETKRVLRQKREEPVTNMYRDDEDEDEDEYDYYYDDDEIEDVFDEIRGELESEGVTEIVEQDRK